MGLWEEEKKKKKAFSRIIQIKMLIYIANDKQPQLPTLQKNIDHTRCFDATGLVLINLYIQALTHTSSIHVQIIIYWFELKSKMTSLSFLWGYIIHTKMRLDLVHLLH